MPEDNKNGGGTATQDAPQAISRGSAASGSTEPERKKGRQAAETPFPPRLDCAGRRNGGNSCGDLADFLGHRLSALLPRAHFHR